jgi:penicillin-binding protein 1A
MNFRLTKNNVLILLVLTCGILFGAAGGVLVTLTRDLPQIRDLESFKPSALTRIYSADNLLLSEHFVEKRDPIPLDNIPDILIKAILATEDQNFYRHSGVDMKGILRAIYKDIRAKKIVEGASTITQQLAKTLFLTPKKTLVRKLKEVILAFQLERRYTKNEILELYLNQVYFGSGAYGIKAAGRTFFDKSLESLTISESALLAGMPKLPSRFSPLINKGLAIKRRNTVLRQMVNSRIITKDEYKKALSEPLQIVESRGRPAKAPYLVQYVLNILEEEVGSSLLYRGGLTIFTTLDYDLQKEAESAVLGGLAELEARMKQKKIQNPNPQAAVICLDVKTGSILAMVGGKDFFQSPFNRAISAKRQPGSSFKAILYAYAIEKGFSQNKLILDAPVVYQGKDKNTTWKPENFKREYLGEITLRKALALSKNIPAVRLMEKLGPSSVADFAHSLGIKSDLSPYLSLALGTSEVKLIELTSAFAVFPNQGEHITPFAITEVHDRSGRIIWNAKPKKKITMSRTGAAIITDMLQAVIMEGTGRKAKILRQPLAGKTGTTNEYKDAFFIGFSPSIATGVWVGQDSSETLGKDETGAKAALPIWINVMKKAETKSSRLYFDFPDETVKVQINPVTGHSAPATYPNSVEALFKKGSEPDASGT